MYQGQTMTVRNDGKKAITVTYDSKPYEFPAGEAITLPIDIARVLKARTPDLAQVSVQTSSLGAPEEFAMVENTSDEAISAAYDGFTYTFEPGVPTQVPKAIVSWLIDRTDLQGKIRIVEEAPAVTPAVPTTDETNHDAPSPAPRKQPRRTKKLTPTAE